jgi:hypothetical protein
LLNLKGECLMKVQLTVKSAKLEGDKVLIETDEGKGQLEFDAKGQLKESLPAVGSKIMVTLSADGFEAHKEGLQIRGRFHGVVSPPAETGEPARSSDFGG